MGAWPSGIVGALALVMTGAGMAGARRVRRDDRPEAAA
jgi:hypothetical protein